MQRQKTRRHTEFIPNTGTKESFAQDIFRKQQTRKHRLETEDDEDERSEGQKVDDALKQQAKNFQSFKRRNSMASESKYSTGYDLNQSVIDNPPDKVHNSTFITENLIIGNRKSAYNGEQQYLNKVTHVINVAGKNLKNVFDQDLFMNDDIQRLIYDEGLENSDQFGQIKYYTIDGWEENKITLTLDICLKIFKFVEEAVVNYSSCMVVSVRNRCSSIVVAIVYLMMKLKWDVYRCLEFLNFKKSDIQITKSILMQIINLEKVVQKEMNKQEYKGFLRKDWTVETPQQMPEEPAHYQELDYSRLYKPINGIGQRKGEAKQNAETYFLVEQEASLINTFKNSKKLNHTEKQAEANEFKKQITMKDQEGKSFKQIIEQSYKKSTFKKNQELTWDNQDSNQEPIHSEQKKILDFKRTFYPKTKKRKTQDKQEENEQQQSSDKKKVPKFSINHRKRSKTNLFKIKKLHFDLSNGEPLDNKQKQILEDKQNSEQQQIQQITVDMGAPILKLSQQQLIKQNTNKESPFKIKFGLLKKQTQTSDMLNEDTSLDVSDFTPLQLNQKPSLTNNPQIQNSDFTGHTTDNTGTSPSRMHSPDVSLMKMKIKLVPKSQKQSREPSPMNSENQDIKYLSPTVTQRGRQVEPKKQLLISTKNTSQGMNDNLQQKYLDSRYASPMPFRENPNQIQLQKTPQKDAELLSQVPQLLFNQKKELEKLIQIQKLSRKRNSIITQKDTLEPKQNQSSITPSENTNQQSKEMPSVYTNKYIADIKRINTKRFMEEINKQNNKVEKQNTLQTSLNSSNNLKQVSSARNIPSQKIEIFQKEEKSDCFLKKPEKAMLQLKLNQNLERKSKNKSVSQRRYQKNDALDKSSEQQLLLLPTLTNKSSISPSKLQIQIEKTTRLEQNNSNQSSHRSVSQMAREQREQNMLLIKQSKNQNQQPLSQALSNSNVYGLSQV